MRGRETIFIYLLWPDITIQRQTMKRRCKKKHFKPEALLSKGGEGGLLTKIIRKKRNLEFKKKNLADIVIKNEYILGRHK